MRVYRPTDHELCRKNNQPATQASVWSWRPALEIGPASCSRARYANSDAGGRQRRTGPGIIVGHEAKRVSQRRCTASKRLICILLPRHCAMILREVYGDLAWMIDVLRRTDLRVIGRAKIIHRRSRRTSTLSENLTNRLIHVTTLRRSCQSVSTWIILPGGLSL